jgi:serine/threonine protein kinase
MAAQVKIGSIFAGYRVEGVLGRGGMGVVYLAEQPELGRKVAIKVIAPALASDPDYMERFRRESRLAAAIEHPNAIPIYEAGVADEDTPYLVMRYVEGEDLATLLRREGRLDPRRAAAIVDQIAGALDEAHARGLVHRDVKPANVIVESRRGTEHAYLTDFGLTREMDASSGVTGTGRWVGTIDYASPEQIQGRPVDARCDVYALGCVLFASLTGRLPFERSEDVAKLYAHVSEPPPKPSSVIADVPAELDQVVTRAMAKDPDFRFPSAGDFGRAALSAATGTPVGEPEHSVATGEAAPATEPAPTPVPPTKPSDLPSREPESTVESPEAQPTLAPSTAETKGAEPAPAPPTGPRPEGVSRIARAGGRRRLAVLGGALAVGAAVAIAIIALSGGGGNDRSSSATGGGGKGGDQSSNVLENVDFKPLTTSGFTVQAPDWKVVDNEVPIGQVSFTALLSPDQKQNVQIQYGPPESPTTSAEGARAQRQADTGYEELEFKQTTAAGREAVLYGYIHKEEAEPERKLPEVSRAVIYNYFFEDGGHAWRTRASVATDLPDAEALAKAIATKMATTLEPTG